jgi:glyoxalase family protein
MTSLQPPAAGSIPGIHHVTAITADPQANVDFYAGVLGLRFVKRTVNFDDPGSYHLYVGEELGRPGGIMTFFGWPGAPPGRRGTGQLTQTGFSVPPESMDFWTARLRSHGVEAEPSLRFDDEVLSFTDPDGLALELVAGPSDDRAPREDGPVPAEHGIRGFRAITVMVAAGDPTAALLTGPMDSTGLPPGELGAASSRRPEPWRGPSTCWKPLARRRGSCRPGPCTTWHGGHPATRSSSHGGTP